jgi:hypothetical protein
MMPSPPSRPPWKPKESHRRSGPGVELERKGQPDDIHESLPCASPKDLELGHLGSNWYEQVETITTLDHIGDRYTAPNWLRDNPSHDLDWGTILWEADKAQVRRLLGERPNFEHSSLSHLREAETVLQTKLDELPDDGRYGVIWRRSRPELCRSSRSRKSRGDCGLPSAWK